MTEKKIIYENLDEKDILILRTLQQNAKLTTKQVAAECHLSMTPVFERIRRLENEGYIKRYIKWCKEDGLPNVTDSVNYVKIDGEIGVRQRLVKSPLHLQVCLNRVFEKEEEDTIDILYRCFFWMAYAGISEADTLKIKISDVDLLNRKIVYNNIEYPIYDEAFRAFKKCIELNYFDKKHPRYNNPLRRYRVEGDMLLRGCGGKDSIPNLERVISFKCNHTFTV